ncbi:MAG: MFS transporter [Scytonema sp. RU_4_4]|nr:MFS transporter [Scytonema sp. RU_4_4]
MQTQSKSSTSIFQDKNFYIINSVTLMAILGGTIFNPTLPTIQKFFQVSEDQASWVATLFQLPGAFVTPIFGVLADILGRKQILVPSLLIFALGGAFSGLASSFTSLLGWRFLQGVGTASLESLQLTIIGDLYQGRKLGAAMAFNASLIGMSSAIFPLIGGFLGLFSWRYPFLCSLVAIIVAFLVLTTLRLPRRQQNAERFQLKSYLQSTWSSINNRQVFGLLFAVMSLFMLQTGTCLTFLPFLATNKFSTSEAVNGILLTCMSLSLAIVASQLGRLLQNLSEIKLIKLSFLLFAVALLLVPLVPNIWLLFIPIFLMGAAQGLAFPCSQALLAGLSAQESRAGFMAVNSTLQSWGQTLGPLLGSFAVKFWGLQAVFYTSAVFSLIGFAIFNYFVTSKVFDFTAKTIQLQVPVNTEQLTLIPESASPTILQQPIAQLFHVQTNRVIELPEHFQVINIGKSSNRITPEIDLLDFPNSGVVSRVHAQIRYDGNEYYIQDLNSSNGTYINKYPLIPGVWYKLKSGLQISLGRQDAFAFIFQID